MKYFALLGAMALALALPACASDPSTGDPTLLGVKFSFGAKANAQLVSLGAKLDAGGSIVMTDVQGLCQIGAKIAPAVTASAALIPASAQPQTQTALAAINATVGSPTCTDQSGDSLQEVVDLAKTIVAIKAATGGVVTATKAAGS